MPASGIDSELEVELSKERQNLFEKLSDIFGPEIANDYVSPKTNETRQQLSIEELRLQGEAFKHTPSRIVIYTTAKASYQSFVRDQVAQQSPRHELEQYVRNSSDIDSAKRYVNMANDVLINPQQSLLLFRSSKLNEKKANLLKSSSRSNSLQQLNHDPSIQKYFPERLSNTSRYSNEDEDEFFTNQQNLLRCRSMHLKHNEKKYHVQFLKKNEAQNTSSHPTTNRHLLLTERLIPKNIESLFSTENSVAQGLSSDANTLNIHRESFPPLSLSALKEYRPSVSPKLPSLRRTSSTINIQRRKPMRKAHFLWNQSIVSSTKHE